MQKIKYKRQSQSFHAWVNREQMEIIEEYETQRRIHWDDLPRVPFVLLLAETSSWILFFLLLFFIQDFFLQWHSKVYIYSMDFIERKKKRSKTVFVCCFFFRCSFGFYDRSGMFWSSTERFQNLRCGARFQKRDFAARAFKKWVG